MSEENAESWDEDQIEAWEHDRWLMMQEMGNNFYKDNEVDPFEEEERVKWQEEEERAKASYFQMIKGEEEKGYFRQTVAELVEERSAAKKLRAGAGAPCILQENLCSTFWQQESPAARSLGLLMSRPAKSPGRSCPTPSNRDKMN